MRRRNKYLLIAGIVVVLLIGARLALEPILLDYANDKIDALHLSVFDKVLGAVGLDQAGDATRGVHAQVKGATVEITVVVVIAAGSVVAEVAKAVQAKVAEAVQGYGLTVTGVHVKVDDIERPGQTTPSL